ncbi:MAG TPA: hypothetical protein VG942_06870 [Hyphomonadaceae bacterium]|nr:hypothetical protein [Hyphomonadaceae bacterium]
MIRFFLVFLSAASAFVGLIFLSTAHAHADLRKADITGEWSGKYICGQGVTALQLHIAKGQGKAITATFIFGPLPENPTVPNGAYQMRGTFDPATSRMKLSGIKWIKAPDGYIMVGLDGHLALTGEKITGVVPDLYGCTDFEVFRPSQLIS